MLQLGFPTIPDNFDKDTRDFYVELRNCLQRSIIDINNDIDSINSSITAIEGRLDVLEAV